MRKTLLGFLFSVLLLLTGNSPLPAQNAPPPPAPEGKRFERDETSVTIPYGLAGMTIILVMILVCMPARRE